MIEISTIKLVNKKGIISRGFDIIANRGQTTVNNKVIRIESACSMRGLKKELSQIVLVRSVLKIPGIFPTFLVIPCLLTEYLKWKILSPSSSFYNSVLDS